MVAQPLRSSLRRIYQIAMAIRVSGLLTALRLPELPLRRTLHVGGAHE